MLIYFVTFIPFILFFLKYSLPSKQLQPWAKSLKNVFSIRTKRKSYSKLKTDATIEKIKTTEPCLLDLPDLPLESILEKLEPADLCRTACVSTYLRDICLSDRLWNRHLKQKWGRIIGCAAQKEWHLHLASQEQFLVRGETRGFVTSYFWRFMKMFKSTDAKTSSQPFDSCSIVSCYRALETGRFWFPAQVFNRENGHVGFVMSCYDAELSYDSHTDTFEARYPPHGPRAVAAECGVTWDRLRKARVDDSPHNLHISDCLNDLRPQDHIEIQWRRNKHFPYGWWYGVIGHLESCDGNLTYCRCHESDTVVLEFKQYAPGSRWRHMTINRKDHREEGNETEGFYGGIRKLYNKDEICLWQQFWPTDILE